MRKLLYYVIAALAGWLLVSPFLLGYQGDAVSIAIAMAAAVVVAALAFIGAGRSVSGPSYAITGCGVLLLAWGLVGFFIAGGSGLNEVLIGLAWLGVSFVIPKIQPASEMVAYDVYGNPMANIKKITIKDGDIAAKATLLGSMPATMYMRPEEIWSALGMISFETIVGLPKFLVVGASRVNKKSSKAP